MTDGGIEVIDLNDLRSEGIVIDEATVGGNLSSLVMVSGSDGYAVVTDENFVNTVKRLDLATQSVSQGLDGLSGGFVPGLGVFGTRLYVLDQGSFSDPASGGVKVYDVNRDELLAGPISPPVCRRRALRSSAARPISMVIAKSISAISWYLLPALAGQPATASLMPDSI